MIPSHRIATHPGIILLKEFLEHKEITQKTLATHLGISMPIINDIVNGKRGISPEIAWLLSEAFTTSPEFWLNLQSNYELSRCKPVTHLQPLLALNA